MNNEKSELIDFLCESDPDAVENGFSMYSRLGGNFNVTGIVGNAYKLSVTSEARPSTKYGVVLEITVDTVDAHCNCAAHESWGNCKHIIGSVIHILIRAYKLTLTEIRQIRERQLVGNQSSLVKKNIDTAAVEKVSNNLNETEVVEIEMPWKHFNSRPTDVFSTVYYSFGFTGRKLVSDAKIVRINETVPEWNFEVIENRQKFRPSLRYNRDKDFSFRCDCNIAVNMCKHVRAAFTALETKYDRTYFLKFKDFDAEKNEMLRPYGLTVHDKESGEINFKTDPWGHLIMEKPSWLWKVDVSEQIKGFTKILGNKTNLKIGKSLIANNGVVDFEVGFLLNLTSQHFKNGFELEAIKVFEKNNKFKFKKLVIHDNQNLSYLRNLDQEFYDLLTNMTDDGLKEQMRRQGFGYVFNYSSPWLNLDSQAAVVLKRLYFENLHKAWKHLCNHPYVFVLQEGTFSNANIGQARLSPDFLKISFVVVEEEKYIEIFIRQELNGEQLFVETMDIYYGFIFKIDNVLYLPENVADMDVIHQFEHGFIKIPIAAKEMVVKSMIPLLRQRYKVVTADSLNVMEVAVEPTCQLLLREMDNKFLVLQPQFVYEDVIVDYEAEPENIYKRDEDGKVYVYLRNKEKELTFFEQLRGLHPSFSKKYQNNFHFLPFEETMKNGWFIQVIPNLIQEGVTVLGLQDLSRHKYNTNKPKWEMKAGSGIDWFDISIEVSFGDQLVSLSDVRKAIINKQGVVVLGDGTIGALPEEWIKKFGMLMKMGDEQNDGKLRVSKLHFTIIDELYGQIDDEKVLREIAEKKQKLQNIGNIKEVQVSEKINAQLRPYQVSGFQWFHTLDEMGWGGCLADDMGLGKTLQTIVFLQYLKEKHPGCTHLIVCPTSLIYNWENELKKFSPDLKYHIYYGLEREFTDEHFNDYDLVITSYGIIRNDLQSMMQFQWHYIILDESQTIKNPDGLTNKALQVMKCKNKMILSGTPVQNNTYDLYAQFNFINPGLLGNREFFRTEFANPIDKNNDTEKSAQLRRLVFPFMLRRTKGQVTKDLPDKTETILWCEMGKAQKKVYNEYKDHYRKKLMEKIAEVGMAKAGMYVLEGLLRLRQICDSPELLKNDLLTKESIKTEELLREVEENTGTHKILVFSQFVEMLQLIENCLKTKGIEYAYLDGSTPAKDRREAVSRFQTDTNVRVFLLSIKAGGVGLNLTAADYVYIVDPWWNPAVELQAIDRTHRIGQVNKIFAYKMICKNTVEEKIVQLQSRKKQLANDLVTEDAGFIKKLNKDDIEYLFS